MQSASCVVGKLQMLLRTGSSSLQQVRACCLWLQVWARRLNLSSQPDGLTLRMQAALVAHLAQTGVLVSQPCSSCKPHSQQLSVGVALALQPLLRDIYLACKWDKCHLGSTPQGLLLNGPTGAASTSKCLQPLPLLAAHAGTHAGSFLPSCQQSAPLSDPSSCQLPGPVPAAHACTFGAMCLRLSAVGRPWTTLVMGICLLPTSPDMCALLGLLQSHIYSAQTTCRLSCLQNEAMSHQQLLRSVLAALANPATFTRGLFMAWQQQSEEGAGAGTPAPRQPPMQAAWRRHCPVVFVDATGWLNLAGSMSKAALAQVCCFRGHPLFAEPRWHRVNSLPEGRGAHACDCHILLQVCQAIRDMHAEHFAQATSLSSQLVPMALPTKCHAPEGSAMSSSQPPWSFPLPWVPTAAAGILRLHAA